MKLLNHVRTIGPAVWLFLLYQNNANYSGDLDWASVLDARPVRDSDAAEALRVPVHTVIRWRRRLEKVGMVRTIPCRRGGFKIWLRCSDLFGDQLASRVPESESWPTMQTEVVQ